MPPSGVGAAWPTDQALTVVEFYNPPCSQDVDAHVAYLRSLRDRGILLMAGPYDGGPAKVYGDRPLGMVILAVTEADAAQIAEADPLVRDGARYVVRGWIRTF